MSVFFDSRRDCCCNGTRESRGFEGRIPNGVKRSPNLTRRELRTMVINSRRKKRRREKLALEKEYLKEKRSWAKFASPVLLQTTPN